MTTECRRAWPERRAAFPPEEFVSRRERLFDAIGEDGHALLQGAPPPRGYVIFRQSNELYYCCGLETPQACLLLSGPERKAALYLPWRGKGALEEGAPPGAEDGDLVRAITGVDAVKSLDGLWEDVQAAKVVHTPHAPAELCGATRPDLLQADRAAALDPWDGLPSREQRLIALLRTRLPRAEVRDLTPILDEMRSVKSPREVAVMRRAGQLAARAVREAMRVTRPGLREYHLGALAGYIYRLGGARGEGYRPIIASGERVWHIHYFLNDGLLEDGNLVLMDVAPECDYYTSDIGRMWPVNGVYAPWQRELYGYVVEYHKALLATIRPGVTPDQVMNEAAAAMRATWERWSFTKDIYREAARRTLEFRGHLSHPVVHGHADGV
ncbi:MAG: Xaa-Pro peptidase family protein, partial [Anaerolineae bacterium]|nr:Xaa-Pro peptidase family protein [Anaerolineae bacterium]